jgi:hypothetical protein
VLINKHQELTFIDEYDELEFEEFHNEVARFVRKKAGASL